jgi:predicted AAA+ superfamily ATPase
LLEGYNECPEAITALKYLAQQDDFDVIATGSLLGIKFKEAPSFPVGYAERLKMRSFDFEEFLWATGADERLMADVRSAFEARERVPDLLHGHMLERFREFIVVGGMPAAVREFAKSGSFAEVLRVQRNIVADYLNDIAKYASGNEKTKARECFLSIPRQLSHSYKKFRYSTVEKNGSSRKYAGSLMWLVDADIVSFCHNLSRIELPLEGHAVSDEFKVYMQDTGLLASMLEEGSAAEILSGNLGIYKGAIYENVVAETLSKLGRRLYYFAYRSQMEVDFVIRLDIATAVEVKSAENTKSKSLKAALQSHGAQRGIKLSAKNVSVEGPVTSLPLYMAMLLGQGSWGRGAGTT